MRVIGYIEHTPYQVTVFKNNQRFRLQFETNHYELAFKIRESEEIKTLADIQELVTAELVASVGKRFQEMHQSALAALAALRQSKMEQEEFEDII